MGDVPIQIFLLCDADECASNESLKDARSKSSIKDIEMEYENWINLFGKPIEISQKGLHNEFPRIRGGLAQLIGRENCITAYVDRDHMVFFPFNLI